MSYVWEVIAPLIAAALGAILLSLASSSGWIRRWAVRRPVRRALRTVGNGPTAPRSLQQVASLLLDVRPAADAEPIMSGLADDGRTALTVRPRLHTLLAEVGDPAKAALTARLLFSEDARSLADKARRARTSLTPFASLQKVAVRSAFADLVTDLSGAPILADASDARGGVAHEAVVWHRRQYRGGTTEGTYDEVHDRGCSAWGGSRRPGDYDSRTLDLDSVALVEDRGRGRLAFLLGTAETCYGATEQGQQPWGCKHLPPLGSDQDPGTRWVDGERAGTRHCLLTSYISLVTADGALVLAKRSGTVRTGLDVLSATGGGVCEPGGPERGIDALPSGWPDPVGTGLRELREEIGLELERHQVRPVAVFLANSIGQSHPVEQSHSVEQGGVAWEGQLVASLLSVARTPLSLRELEQLSLHAADLADGAFEVAGLVAVDLSTVDEVAAWSREHATELDQHGFLSLLYAARLKWGAEATTKAFSTAFSDRRWWQLPRPGAPSRVWADPARLITTSSA